MGGWHAGWPAEAAIKEVIGRGFCRPPNGRFLACRCRIDRVLPIPPPSGHDVRTSLQEHPL
ncbi:MAG: hypothetical protein EBZ13_03700 [Planctomycetia bacterium]|nr:hypothetical protein [Planctomycetia bacterium]